MGKSVQLLLSFRDFFFLCIHIMFNWEINFIEINLCLKLELHTKLNISLTI